MLSGCWGWWRRRIRRIDAGRGGFGDDVAAEERYLVELVVDRVEGYGRGRLRRIRSSGRELNLSVSRVFLLSRSFCSSGGLLGFHCTREF